MILLDAANVIGSRPDGWWRDRPAAAARLVEQVRSAVREDRLEAPVVVVLEGAARNGAEEGNKDGVDVVHAPGGGDDELVRQAAAVDERVIVVTADRALKGRLRAQGAEVAGPSWLFDRLG